MLLGRLDEADTALRGAIERWPDRRDRFDLLVRMRQLRGDEAGAREALGFVLAQWPCDAGARNRSAMLAGKLGDVAGKLALLSEGEAQCELPPALLNELAWTLASTREEALRDGPRAVALAERVAVALPQQPQVLDTLAAAHAEAGDFDEAIRIGRQAVELASRSQLPEAARQQLADHLATFERGEAIRE